MSQTPTALVMQPSQDELKNIYLAGLRKRFKSEINRMTRGDMAALLRGWPDAERLSFLMSYVFALHWLQHNVGEDDRRALLAAFGKGAQGFLMALLLQSGNGDEFVAAYVQYWLNHGGEPQLQQQHCLQLLADHGNDVQRLARHVMRIWNSLGLFRQGYAVAYRDLARQERQRYREMLGPQDRERLALVDALPDLVQISPRFAKLGVVPHMGCPQACRHCMFVFRPLVKKRREPADLFRQLDALTDSILFTGGDLSKHLAHFYDAIGMMRNVRTFAILLNGDFADSRETAESVLDAMARTVRRRPSHWPRARVLLQISFDEFHQEVYPDKKGRLKERIPVYKIANIVETAPRFSDEIQLCLVHKQHALNFSMELFSKGVFGRLAAELGRRGHQLQVLSAAPSVRLKRNPQDPRQPAKLVKDASFVLARYPNTPMMLTSSTMDAYGRASLMDPSETVNEKDLLQRLLSRGDADGECFDIDPMFWFNGWVTLFSAVHMCLGNVFDDGMEKVIQRQRKDPLSKALHDFDTRLLGIYNEVRGDLEERITVATGPHHLFHMLTEDAAVRLHMTRRLIEMS